MRMKRMKGLETPIKAGGFFGGVSYLIWLK